MDENKDKACHHHSPTIYQPRHSENTLLYQILQEDLETWITQTQENGGYVPSHVEKDFREYLKCGLLCYGFARARCTCGNPKRLRYFLYHNPKVTSKVLRIFFYEIRKQLIQHYQHTSDNPIKIGGINFIHRFGSSLNVPHIFTA